MFASYFLNIVFVEVDLIRLTPDAVFLPVRSREQALPATEKQKPLAL
jgi:hypothetical protein